MENKNITTPSDNMMLVSTFSIGDATFGIDTIRVLEVIMPGCLTVVHNSPPWILGVMNLRGKIITIFDTAIRLNLKSVKQDEDCRVYVVDWEDEYVGLFTGCIGDTVLIPTVQMVSPPDNLHGIQAKLLTGVFSTNEKTIAMFDINALLSNEM